MPSVKIPTYAEDNLSREEVARRNDMIPIDQEDEAATLPGEPGAPGQDTIRTDNPSTAPTAKEQVCATLVSDDGPPSSPTGGTQDGKSASNDPRGQSSLTHATPGEKLARKTQRSNTGSAQQAARNNSSPTGHLDAISKMGDPPSRDPFHRAIEVERQDTQHWRIRLRVAIKARSSQRLDLNDLDNTRVLTWLNRRHAALDALLVPMPCPSRLTAQAPDSPGSPSSMKTSQGSVPVSIGPIKPMAVSSRDPGPHSNSTRDITETGALPGAAASYHHDQCRQPRRGGHWQETRNPSARPGLMEWVLSAPVASWSISATRETSGGTIRESYSFRASTVRQADRVYSGRFPSMSGLHRTFENRHILEATQHPPPPLLQLGGRTEAAAEA